MFGRYVENCNTTSFCLERKVDLAHIKQVIHRRSDFRMFILIVSPPSLLDIEQRLGCHLKQTLVRYKSTLKVLIISYEVFRFADFQNK